MKTKILRTLIIISIPTIIEEILATLLQYVDTAMVGRLGEQATASVSVTTTVSWLVGSVASALGVAALAMIAKAVGSGDTKLTKRISSQVLLLASICGVVLSVVSMALSPFIPRWMGAEQSIWKAASTYFFIISTGTVFRAWNSILGAAIRATKDTKTPMIINLAVNILNVVLNYLFIYGCGLGVTGAAAATALSYGISGILMFAAYRRNEYLCWEWKKFRPDTAIIRECIQLSLPVLGTGITSCFGYVVFASLVTGMGNTVFAAHSIAVTAETIFYIPGYGLRTATSTMVGNALGEGNHKKIETVGSMSVVITMGMMVLNGFLLYFAALPLMQLFTPSMEVAGLGAGMLRMVAFSEPFFGLMIVVEGIFYGLGRTRYAFVIETFSMWCVRILFTFLCVRVWNLGLRAVWGCMIADNVCKALLFTLPVLTKKGRMRLLIQS